MRRAAWLGVALATLAPGCSRPPAGTGGPEGLVPVQGVITIDSQPLAGAVVSFLPTDEQGTLTIAETDDDGSYLVRYLGAPGTAPGPYKVGVSLMETHDGKIMGLSPRSALAMPPGYETAAERVPARYSDLGRSVLTAEVPETGGTIDFELEGPLLDPPTLPDSGEEDAAVTDPGEGEAPSVDAPAPGSDGPPTEP